MTRRSEGTNLMARVLASAKGFASFLVEGGTIATASGEKAKTIATGESSYPRPNYT